MNADAPLRMIRLTSPGRGAIATLLVEGAGAVRAVASRFRPRGRHSLSAQPSDRPLTGHFRLSCGKVAPAEEELVVRRRSGCAVELHCHGGTAAIEAIQETLAELGCQPITWQQWVTTYHEDYIATAARKALAEAPTGRTAAILLDQFHGALRREVMEIEKTLRAGATEMARQRIETLLARADVGRHLTRPWRVVLGGGPNVGKSRLLNALLGYRRAIVHTTAGTTRDLVTARTAIDGWPVELCDTAGLGRGGEAVEQAGIERARQQLADADLAILVFDATAAWTAEDDALLRAHSDALVVHNKADLPPAEGERPPGLLLSAITGDGLPQLLRAVVERLVPNPPPRGAAVPFTREQCRQLRQLCCRR